MARKGVLKPIGALAEHVTALARKKVKAPDADAARRALLDAEPDLADIVEAADLDRFVSRLAKAADQQIAGETAVQSLIDLAHDLQEAGLRLTHTDLARCLEKTLQLQTSRGGAKFRRHAAGLVKSVAGRRGREGYKHAFGGELRERVVQHLAEVRILADILTNEVKKQAKAAGHKRPTIVDTAHVGDVRMPTNPASGAEPVLDALGPDRIFGFIERDAAAKASGFAGTFHVTALIEVKARTGGLAGLDQTQKFIARASHGEILIDGKRYRLVVDDKTLHRTVILPEDAIDLAQIRSFAKKEGIDVLPFSAKIEDMISRQAETQVGRLMQLASLLGQ